MPQEGCACDISWISLLILFAYTCLKSSNGQDSLAVWTWRLLNIGIKQGFSCINIRQVRGRCWKSRPEAVVFNTSQGTWRMLMHWKPMFERFYCIKTENICYISRYFLHYFVSHFHRCLANAVSTDYAHSRVGQYISCNGSKSVAPVRSYWKLRSRALTARELPC